MDLLLLLLLASPAAAVPSSDPPVLHKAPGLGFASRRRFRRGSTNPRRLLRCLAVRTAATATATAAVILAGGIILPAAAAVSSVVAATSAATAAAAAASSDPRRCVSKGDNDHPGTGGVRLSHDSLMRIFITCDDEGRKANIYISQWAHFDPDAPGSSSGIACFSGILAQHTVLLIVFGYS
jgi:hypothetical protein